MQCPVGGEMVFPANGAIDIAPSILVSAYISYLWNVKYSPVQMKFNSMFPSISQEIEKVSKHVIYHWKTL